MHEAHLDLDYGMFKFEKYVCDYPWLYFILIDAGYKCKIGKMFPPLSPTGGNARWRFANETVKSLTDHPRHFLDGHQTLFKHINVTKEYEGIISFYST